jgi:lipoprotein-anchoring transpeptidase ErfK/SrfK
MMNSPDLSRRDFLKLSGYSLMGIFLPNLPRHFLADEFADLQGRVTDRSLWTYDAPSTKAKQVKLYWRDLIVPITTTAVNEEENTPNRIWYQISENEYAYSGAIQPVRTILNAPQTISLKGALGEVSVPYTEARESAEPNAKVIHRLYYETVHWITASAISQTDGSAWYCLLEDKFHTNYYIPARHMRLIPDSELTPLSPNVPNEKKSIEVRLKDQLVLAYEDEKLVFAARASTGRTYHVGPRPTYVTPIGNFITFHKRPTRHMAAGDITASGFDLPGVPWVLYITDSGISLHGTYWHNDFGRPRSHGCVNLTPAAAKWLYRWTIPYVEPGKEFAFGSVGTQVHINP